MESEQHPGHRPEKQIPLALEGIDVGKKQRDQQRGEQKSERDEALDHREVWGSSLVGKGKAG